MFRSWSPCRRGDDPRSGTRPGDLHGSCRGPVTPPTATDPPFEDPRPSHRTPIDMGADGAATAVSATTGGYDHLSQGREVRRLVWLSRGCSSWLRPRPELSLDCPQGACPQASGRYPQSAHHDAPGPERPRPRRYPRRTDRRHVLASTGAATAIRPNRTRGWRVTDAPRRNEMRNDNGTATPGPVCAPSCNCPCPRVDYDGLCPHCLNRHHQ